MMKRWTLFLVFATIFFMCSAANAKVDLGEQVADRKTGVIKEQIADQKVGKKIAKKEEKKKIIPREEKAVTEKKKVIKEKEIVQQPTNEKSAEKKIIERETTEMQKTEKRVEKRNGPDEYVNVGEKDLTIIILGFAEQIGVSPEQFFPWYVKQQRIEAWAKILSGLILFFIGIGIASSYYYRINWTILNGYVVLSGTGAIIAFAAALFLAFNLGTAISKLFNPNYYALRALIDDVSKLL